MSTSQTEDLLCRLEEALQTHSCPCALGLDMAADEDNWGLCILLVAPDLSSARLPLLLPQAKINAGGTCSRTYLCRPTLKVVEQALHLLHQRKVLASLAVDIPFGWPVEHRRFVEHWSATEGWKVPTPLPGRAGFERRLCDRQLQARYAGVRPLAVGADQIAQAAFRWAEVRRQLCPLVGMIDVGLDDRPVGFCTFETYPAAFVRLFSADGEKYKSVPEIRRRLLGDLRKRYPLQTDRAQDGWLEWACQQSGSPDAFDALLCALTAWDHLRCRTGQDGTQLTTPGVVLGRPATPEEAVLIREEGWILVRTARSGGPA
jgi:hypothetical protein